MLPKKIINSKEPSNYYNYFRDEYQKYINQLNMLRIVRFEYLMESYESILMNLLNQMIKKRHRMGDVYFEKLEVIIDDLKTR
jgi:hypothetical protein